MASACLGFLTAGKRALWGPRPNPTHFRLGLPCGRSSLEEAQLLPCACVALGSDRPLPSPSAGRPSPSSPGGPGACSAGSLSPPSLCFSPLSHVPRAPGGQEGGFTCEPPGDWQTEGT